MSVFEVYSSMWWIQEWTDFLLLYFLTLLGSARVAEGGGPKHGTDGVTQLAYQQCVYKKLGAQRSAVLGAPLGPGHPWNWPVSWHLSSRKQFIRRTAVTRLWAAPPMPIDWAHMSGEVPFPESFLQGSVAADRLSHCKQSLLSRAFALNLNSAHERPQEWFSKNLKQVSKLEDLPANFQVPVIQNLPRRSISTLINASARGRLFS